MGDGPGPLGELRHLLGPEHVLDGASDLATGFLADWTGRWTGACLAVVRPGSTDEVAGVMEVCADHGIPVVPQGGNTGLVAGAVPEPGSVVVSTRRLDEVGPLDVVAGQITVAAGVTLAAVHEAVDGSGWRYAVDFAARDTATIGGTVATNAGGHHVLRHGMTRRQVVGLEAVLADGRVIAHLGGLLKDNTGYDLSGLLCGSEGTLGIITAVRLALVPDAGHRATAMVGFADLEGAMQAVGRLRRSLPGLEAAEVMLADGLAAVGRHLDQAPPLADPVVVLVEVVAEVDPLDALADALASLDGLGGTAAAPDERTAAGLWRWREAHTEVINSVGPHPPHKFDVSLPLGTIAAFVPQVRAAVAEAHPGATVWIFGHAGDGNLHVNVTGPPPTDVTVDDVVLRLVADHDGSISAEHGIGRAKRDWLVLSRSAEEIATFRAVKAALDPDGLLNPGVLLP